MREPIETAAGARISRLTSRARAFNDHHFSCIISQRLYEE
jgi:hypothetical protein